MTFVKRSESGKDTFTNLKSSNIDDFYKHNLNFNGNRDETTVRFRKLLDIADDVLRESKIPLKVHSALHSLLLNDFLIDEYEPSWKPKFSGALDNFLTEMKLTNQEQKKGEFSNEMRRRFWEQYSSRTRTNATDKDKA
jgi:hypothetical protein